METTTVAEFVIVDIICIHRAPKSLLSDQGPQFTSELFDEVTKVLEVKQKWTTSYHPECNGLVERFNGTLVKTLAKLTSITQTDWDCWIPFVLFVYKTTVHPATNETPDFIIHG